MAIVTLDGGSIIIKLTPKSINTAATKPKPIRRTALDLILLMLFVREIVFRCRNRNNKNCLTAFWSAHQDIHESISMMSPDRDTRGRVPSTRWRRRPKTSFGASTRTYCKRSLARNTRPRFRHKLYAACLVQIMATRPHVSKRADKLLRPLSPTES